MDVIETIKKDKAYLKCKFVVKDWEKNFKLKHARTPSKFDIKEAPSKIRYAYKKYFQMKSAALDCSLNIGDIEQDSTPFKELSFGLENADNSMTSTFSPETAEIMQSLPTGQQLENLLQGAKINQSESTNIVKKKNDSPFVNNLSKKLFESRKFSFRNPRKISLNKSSQCGSIIDESCSNTDANASKVDSQNVDDTSHSNNYKINENSSYKIINEIDLIKTQMHSANVRKISEAWLERTTGIKIEDKSTVKNPVNFGIRNLETNVEKTNDYIENSESDSDDLPLMKIKPALKKRKLNNLTTTNVTTKLIVPSTNSNSDINVPSKEIKENYDSVKRGTKSKCATDTVKQSYPDIHEFLPFGLEENVKPLNISKIIVEPNDNRKSVCSKQIDKIQQRIENGTLNENFVRINIEKKIYVRGKKTTSYSKYKKQQWKDKKALHAGMEFPESGKITCFKCNGCGHMARYCTAHRGDALLPLENDNDDSMPTLQDMENAVSSVIKDRTINSDPILESVYKPTPIPDSFLKILEKTPSQGDKLLSPIYNDPKVITKELYEVLQMFGYDSFRQGQAEAIMRILCGMSTLLILSTGGGKSLCYQIPAYIYAKNYKCITLVISPLVSLMEDQVLSMPDFLKAGCLHTNQPPTQRQKVMQCIKDGELNILLISPEALVSGDVSSSGFAGLFKSLPPIAFACIDEAHCVSQWSHNFRPSYLMISRVLREKLKVKCILGLTATASKSTISSIVQHLNINDGLNGVITNPTLPDNLILSVSSEKDKDRALLSLLVSDKLSQYNSIIIYCIRRDECERVAAVVRSSLQDPGKINMENKSNKRKRMSYIAESYHAGMSAAQRKKIQKHFMDGTLRIIVATVAFGMGINKSDIRCIIHYNMPSSFESYVQEVGRAGRDGKPAYCHVFISSNSGYDTNELLKHIHANTIDRQTIRKLLEKVFINCGCTKVDAGCSTSSETSSCPGHEIGIPIEQTVEELDIPSENIATLLCYLELHPNKYIKVLNNSYTMCKIVSYAGPKKLLEAAKTCPPLAMAYVLEGKNSSCIKNNIFEFNVIKSAAAVGWDSGMAKYHLKNLEWETEGGKTRRSQINVEFNTLGFRIKAIGDLNPTQLDNMLDDLHGLVLTQEKTKLYQLEEIKKAFSNLAIPMAEQLESNIIEYSFKLKTLINHYFEREHNVNEDLVLEKRSVDEERALSDIRFLITAYKDCSFTGRSIARIFQGISSPNYPAIVWGKCKFWRTHLHEDFYGLVKLATQQLIQMKMN